MIDTHNTNIIQRSYSHASPPHIALANLSIPLEGAMEIFLVVRPHRRLPFLSEADAFERYPGFMTKIVDAAPSDVNALVIIEPTRIITHLTPMPRRNLFFST